LKSNEVRQDVKIPKGVGPTTTAGGCVISTSAEQPLIVVAVVLGFEYQKPGSKQIGENKAQMLDTAGFTHAEHLVNAVISTMEPKRDGKSLGGNVC
jgi:hypothetical protein